MVLREKFRVVSVFVSIVFLSLSVIGQRPIAKSKVKLHGTVVAYKVSPSMFGRNSFLGVTDIFIVKVSKVTKGREKSEYLIVRSTGINSELTGLEINKKRLFEFNLERANFCDTQLRRLMEFTVRNDQGEIIETVPNLDIPETIDKASFPLDKTLPCYYITTQ